MSTRTRRLFPILVMAGLILGGCGGKPEEPAGQSPTTQDGPQTQWVSSTDAAAVAKLGGPSAAVYQFLEAIRTGNDERATAMLTPLARQKWGALGRGLNPPASDTARFELGPVEMLADDGARVASRWTDLDETGQSQTDEALWMVRREPEGWRIVGTAAVVFDGEPPLLLNYEDPEDTLRKLQLVRDEIARREQAATGAREARGTATGPESIRR